VASAPARIWTPHLEGKAVVASQGMLRISMPAHSMPTTRGRRSCQATPAPICADAHSSSVAQAGLPGRNAFPMEKKNTP
jgi:hypothetical protein